MHLLFISDTYPPLRTSGAQHMQDLALAAITNGHLVTVVIPNSTQTTTQTAPVVVVHDKEVRVITVRADPSKDVSHILRTLAEWRNPYRMWQLLQSCPEFMQTDFALIVWYSPSIFWAPLVARSKAHFACPAYLVLRDFFPDWAIHLGLLKKGLPYAFFKWVQKSQFTVATWIGVQSPNNLEYFKLHYGQFASKAEVLWNWIAPLKEGVSVNEARQVCPIDVSKTPLAGKMVLVYAGNMGLAQEVDVIIDLFAHLKDAPWASNLGLLLVGRGSESARLQKRAQKAGLANILFFDEIEPEAIVPLYTQCQIGVVLLDARHASHNIPGKCLSYLQAGLPIFARVNPGNDLLGMAQDLEIGSASSSSSMLDLAKALQGLVSRLEAGVQYKSQTQALAKERFAPQRAIMQITAHI